MMNIHAHPADAQLPLSILFLAIADSARAEPKRTLVSNVDYAIGEREISQEEPERWDGLW